MGTSAFRNAAVIGVASVAALLMWSVARLAGVELELKDSASLDRVGAADVLVATILAGGAAWAVHEFLARSHRQRWWPVVASAALAISINGPSWFADGGTALVLIAMHLVVGFILIAGLAPPMGELHSPAEEHR